MARGRSKKVVVPNRGGMAFGRNLMVLALLIFALGGYGVVMGAMTLKWPRADATITSAELLRQIGTSRGADGRAVEDGWNSFHVLYQYRVGDRDYVAGGVEPYDFGMQNSAGAAKMRERHPVGSKAKVVHEEYTPAQTTDFTASGQRLFDSLKDKPGRKIIAVVWAGAHPLPKLMDLKPERYKIEIAPGGNILPVMAGWKQFPGLEGAIYYYWGFPKNPVNDWLVTEYKKKNNGAPPDFFVAGGMAAAMAVVEAVKKAGSTDTEKLIAAMEGMSFDTPKGKMTFRKEDHQALQAMYQWRMKANPPDNVDLLELVREIPADEMKLPIKNKR